MLPAADCGEYDGGMRFACFVTPRACCRSAWLRVAVWPSNALRDRASRTLILLDGAAVHAKSLEIAAGKLTGEGVPADLTLDDLRRIELAAESAAADKPAVIVELRGGGRYSRSRRYDWRRQVPDRVALGEQRWRCRSTWSGRSASSRRRPAPNSTRPLAAPSAELDRLFVKDRGGQARQRRGLDRVADGRAAHASRSAARSGRFPAQQLFGIVVAQPRADDPASAA